MEMLRGFKNVKNFNYQNMMKPNCIANDGISDIIGLNLIHPNPLWTKTPSEQVEKFCLIDKQ